ncbi:MAG: type II secretion system protein [Leptothrix sp. (in: b-proteobacteria)]
MQRRARRGFTLIELVVTLALLGVLAMVAAPMAEVAVQRSREQELRLALREIRTALDRHKRAADQGQITRQLGDSGYPANLELLEAGIPLIGTNEGKRLYLLRRIPRDPFADPAISAARTWGLRSYASPPDDPRAGDDVFDVYSKSDGIGLNGIPYKQW